MSFYIHRSYFTSICFIATSAMVEIPTVWYATVNMLERDCNSQGCDALIDPAPWAVAQPRPILMY